MINQNENKDQIKAPSTDVKSNEIKVDSVVKPSYKQLQKNIPQPKILPYPIRSGKKIPYWFHQWKTRDERMKMLKELFMKLNKFDFKENFPTRGLYKKIFYWEYFPTEYDINEANNPKYY